MSNAGRGVNKKGRSKRGGGFVMIPHYVFDSSAYQSMKPGPRSLLDCIIRKHNGMNNGEIGMSVRYAGKQLNVSKNTTAKWMKELEARGFIANVRSSGFNVKGGNHRACEWRITWQPCVGKSATKDFLKFKEC